jgi:hypothetical protein
MIIKSLLFIIVCIFCYETYKTLNTMTEEYFISLNKDNSMLTPELILEAKPNSPNRHSKNRKHSRDNRDNRRDRDTFVSLSGTPELDDISKTIAINCKAYPNEVNKIMVYKPEPNSVLDTPYYSQYKPLEFDKDRRYYWSRDKLVEEGIRRSKDDEVEIAKVQALFNKETNNDKKKILQDELDLFKWRKNIFEVKDINTGISREKRDIMSDYYPDEIGLQRPWIERHSHLPNYRY